MSPLIIQELTPETINDLVRIRTADLGNEELWNFRIPGYFNGSYHPTAALEKRIVYIALEEEQVVGFIAGHLSTRFGCAGELQWINVIPEHERHGIASALVRKLAGWFASNNAVKVCVNSGHEGVRLFYSKNGAVVLNEHWMVWEDISRIL